MSNEQKITTEIKVPNKDLETLKTHFPHCFDKGGNFQIEKFKNSLANNEIDFSTESYGLDWLGKSYARLLASDPVTTLLKPDEAHNSKPENANSENLLIKGDNLEVLKHLANAYYGQVKMIYIDPPYNTGSDGFVYEDDRKFTVKELQNLIGVDADKAKRILDFTKQKSNSHSAWLTFMYPRLYIAKQLLKDDGAIFVSIDDNEVSQLKILMDEVFGDENFITQFAWQKKTGASDATGIATITEYILTYSKSKQFVEATFTKNDNSFDESRYDSDDEFIDSRGKYYPDNLDRGGLNYSDSMNFGILCPDGTVAFPNGRTSYFNDGWIWKWSEEKVKWGIKSGFIEFRKSNKKANGWSVCYKNYMYVDNEGNEIVRSAAHKNLLLNILNTRGTDDIKKLFDNKIIFKNSKPVELISRFISFIKFQNKDIVIDFFAGSGTTGDAVMQLNTEDGVSRKFILVQIPETIDSKKNKVSFDFVKNELNVAPTIFEITKERLLRAANKINAGLDEKIEKLKRELSIGENKAEIEKLENCKIQNNFKIFETTSIWDDYYFEAEKFDSSQALFNADKLTEDDIKALLTTWKTYDGIALTQDLEIVDLSGYKAYYGNGKLYLMHKGFTTDSLKALLEKIDTNKHFEPKSIIAFGYHLESKSLREISENVKTYNNKKKSDIDFITRY
jgi:adenine-specific DNA-methyltransferase